MHKLDGLLEHSGVKGMKWGVRHDDKPTLELKSSKLGQKLDSMKRERQWHKALKEVHNMPTKDIKTVTNRIKLENSLKSLSKSKMATSSDKHDYLRRHQMSNEELTRKIARLQAKNDLHDAVKKASKEQRDTAVKAVQIGGSLGLKYATNKKITAKDVLESVTNPHVKSKQTAYDETHKLISANAKHPKVKKALELAKDVKFKTKSKS